MPTSRLRGAAESLLLPLVSRALETERPAPLMRDEKAIEILRSLDYDYSGIVEKQLYHTQIAYRVRYFDEQVSTFLDANPDGVIVNLGCGLDTRFDRLDNGRAFWLEVDLPEAISLRHSLIPEQPRRRYMAASLAGLGWLEAWAEAWQGQQVLFLAEGVLMFLEPEVVQRLFRTIGTRFPGSSFIFDAVRPLELWGQAWHPTLAGTGARLRWGLGSPDQLTRWHPGARTVSEWYYCDQDDPRLGLYRHLRHLRWLASARILKVAFEAPPPSGTSGATSTSTEA